MKSVKLNCVMHTLLHQTLLHRNRLPSKNKNNNQDLLASFLELNVLVRERGTRPNLKAQAQDHASHLSFRKNTCRNNQKDIY